MLGRPGFLDEAHAAKHLNTKAGEFDAGVGRIGLGDRRQQIRQSPRLAIPGMGPVNGGGIVIGQRPHGLGRGPHRHQHAPDIGMGDDLARLHPFAGIGDGGLGCPFSDCHALQANIDPGVVHHGEHRPHPGAFCPDQPADTRTAIAKGHAAGWGGMDAELMLDTGAFQIITAAIRQEFWHQKQGDTFGSSGRIRQPRQHEVNDIVCNIMFAPGDEYLGPLDAVAAIPTRFGPAAQRPDIGAGLRFGEVHGSGPFAAHHPGQIVGLLTVRSMRLHRLNRALGQHHAEREGHVGAGQLFLNRAGEHERQPLPTVGRISAK